MRPSSILSEALRNLATGTTRAGLHALTLAAVLTVLLCADYRAIVGIFVGAQHFRTAGGSIYVLDASGAVDGARCEALEDVDGIVAAGALRAGTPSTLLALPSSDLRVFETTPGMPAVLAVPDAEPTGVLVSGDLAETLGGGRGATIETTDGPSQVAGIYAYPDDGRMTTLEYALLAPVPVTGAFDECWIEVWPSSQSTVNHLDFALQPGVDSQREVTQRQLNSRVGEAYDGARLFANRPTRFVGLVVVVAGSALGFVALRVRRLELAAALHAGVSRVALAWQTMVETLVWAVAGVLVALPLSWWAAAWNNPADAFETWRGGLWVLPCVVAAVVLGATASTALTRERDLFRFFKNR